MKLGQYEIIERIAQGGMAEVYRGRAVGEEGFEKPVAIKRILPHYVSDERFVSMLVQEAGIHAALSHRNIVQIHDLGQSEEGEYFIVLEYVDGRDLGALLEVVSKAAPPGNRVGDALALYVAIELGEGIHFSHELLSPDGSPSGLVHRDISPSNVLLSYAGEVKLSDFGLAKRQSDHSVVGSLKGKLAYMAPEQARRWPLDRRSDIFSLGAVLFELLTGKQLRPISDESEGFRLVASGVMATPRSARPDIPHVLDDLLLRALAPNPTDRFADAAAFVKAARSALDYVPRAKIGEAAELQVLLRNFVPPGQPRPRSEPSRVIRLQSQFLPRGQALALTPPFPIGADGLPRRHSTIQGAPPVPQVPLVAIPAGASVRLPVALPVPASPRPEAAPQAAAVAAAPVASALPRVAFDDADTGRAMVGLPPTLAVAAKAAQPVKKERVPTGKTRREPMPTRVPADDLVPVSGELGGEPKPRVAAPPPAASRAPNAPGSAAAPLPGLLKLKRVGSGPDEESPPARRPTPPPPTPSVSHRPTPPPPPPVQPPVAAAPARRPTPPPPPPSASSDNLAVRRRRPSLPGMPDVPEPPPPPRPSESFEVQLQPVRGTALPGPPAVQAEFAEFAGLPRPTEIPLPGYPESPATPVMPMPDASWSTPRLSPAQSSVVLRKTGGGGLRVVLVLVLLLGTAAAAMHVYLVPLPVLASWWQEVKLRLESDPAGATVTLDGVALAGKTPIEVPVRRDRETHVVEWSDEGRESVRKLVRYDRNEILAESAFLNVDRKRNVEQLPTEPAAGSPVDGGAGDAGITPALAASEGAHAADVMTTIEDTGKAARGKGDRTQKRDSRTRPTHKRSRR